jgi:hypothetical protein
MNSNFRLLLLPDPLRLLRTKEVRNVKAAVGMLVNSAKILSTLTAARALYECNNGANAQLSNELFHQWTQSLVDSTTMHSAGTAAAISCAVFDCCTGLHCNVLSCKCM